jgi:cytochrome P450
VSERIDKRALPPGPQLPAVLQLAATWTRPVGSLLRLRDRYGKRITVQLPFQPPFVILSDPEEIKQLFTAPPDAIHPGEGARILEPIVGRHSVILLDEAPHMEQRKLLLPAFHGERMKALVRLMSELTDHELDSWPVGEPVALHGHLQQLTLEIVLRAVFGLDSGPRLEALRAALTEVLGFSENPLSVLPGAQRKARRLPIMRRFEDALQRTDALIAEQIAERRADPAAPNDDILSVMLQARHEDGSEMDAREIRDELMTALVAGHETTASQLAWAFERLAREPEVTARLREETERGAGDEYLTATIQEVMRLRPVLPNAEPRLTKRPLQIGDVTYPAGVCLLASAFLVHHDPEIYPEPEAFRPERFVGNAPGTYTWLPFGGGRRRCLGASFAMQEMKIVLRAALERYELQPGTKRAERTVRRSITFSPERGGTVVLRARRGAERKDPRPLAVA